MSVKAPILQLQYGVNAHADHVYEHYKPLTSTAYYPDPDAAELKEAISKYVGCAADMIVCGNGSDELIDLYIRIQLMRDPKLKLAISPPTYYQYQNYGGRVGATIVALPHDRAKVTAKLLAKYGCSPKDTIAMLDSPANPSGDIITREQFVDLLEAGYRVFADEAYYEFCDQTVVDLIKRYPKQLVVSRSLSKVAAMAGSRVGYLVGAPEFIAELYRQKLFFNLGSESQRRGLYALEHMSEFKQAITEMRSVKQRLQEDVSRIGTYTLFDSLPMYLIFTHAKVPGEKLQQKLHDSGIETYRFPDFKGYDVLRAAILQMPLMQRLTDTLRTLA